METTETKGITMLIDCDGCAVRGVACSDCVVTALLGAPPDGVRLDDTERRALAALADGGLVSPLRLVTQRSSGGSRRPHVA
jgi:hypothetical protein